MEEKQQILLIHGGKTFENHDNYIQYIKSKIPDLARIKSRRDWKNELQDQLGENFEVYTPQMPNKHNSQYEEWKWFLERILVQLGENLILVGYSLGAIFIVKYLSENLVSKKIYKTFLIGAPFNNEGMETEPLCSFLRSGSLKVFEKQAGNVFFYHSKDDPVVPFGHLEKYNRELPHSKIRIMNDRNHFFQAEIPELILDIKNIEKKW